MKFQYQNLIDNINDNERTLNGYPTKWYISKYFTDIGLSDYYQINKKNINKSIGVRNIIVHEGWSDKWDEKLINYISYLRNALYKAILKYFKYTNDFYPFLENETKK